MAVRDSLSGRVCNGIEEGDQTHDDNIGIADRLKQGVPDNLPGGEVTELHTEIGQDRYEYREQNLRQK